MKKGLKLIITLAVSAALAVLLVITAFAYVTPDYYPEDGSEPVPYPGYGANYNELHDESDCCPYEGSGHFGSSHYEAGYYQGYMDCFEYAGDNLDDVQKQAIINAYLSSPEFQQKIAEAKAQGAEDYKKSEEYTLALLQSYAEGEQAGKDKALQSQQQVLNDSYKAGIKAGYEEAYNLGYVEGSEQMYAKGVSDGYANFRATEEYKNTLQAQYDGGYGAGYTEGVNDAQSAQPSEENTVDISSIITLVLTIVLLSGVVIFVFTNKKFKGRKRK